MEINDNQVLIPMITTVEAALDFGYSRKDIRMWRVGNRILPVILVPGTKEQYDAYINSFVREYKQEDRDKRCQIPGENGCLIRCPEENKCRTCPYHQSMDKEAQGTVTFSDLAIRNEDGSEEEYEPVTPEGYFDDYEQVCEDLIRYVAEKKPECEEVVKLLLEGYSRREIAQVLNLPKSSVIDWAKKIQALTKEFLDNQV